MALTFENERVVYDPEDELVRFFATRARCSFDVAYRKRLWRRLKTTRLLTQTRLSRPTSETGNSSRILWRANTAPVGSRPVGSWSFAFRICPRRLRD